MEAKVKAQGATYWCLSILAGLTTIVFVFFHILCTSCSPKSPQTVSEQYRFDEDGRLASRIAPDGREIGYRYNDLGLPIEISYPDASVQYGYDANGNRTWMKDDTGVTEYYYDAFDRPIGVVSRHSPWRLISYDYDPWGNLRYMSIFNLELMEQDMKYREMLQELRTKSAWQAEKWRERDLKFRQFLDRLRLEDLERKSRWMEYQVGYRHDISGNLKGIDTKWGSIRYEYSPDKGIVERYLPNGIRSTFTYSPDGLLKSLQHFGDTNQTIAEYHYKYNAAGKVIEVNELTSGISSITRYTWDTRGYLKELQLPDNKIIKYDYDPMGNRTMEEDPARVFRYQYDNFGRLSQAGDLRYRWNRNGSLMSEIGGGHELTIEYNSRNLPTLVKIPDETFRYSWDGDGHMVSRFRGGDLTHFLPNPLAPPGYTLAEFDRMGRMSTSYLYGDVLLGQWDGNGQVRYFLEDGFDSIRHISDMNGRIIGQRTYSPFGELTSSTGKLTMDFRMMGERFLPELNACLIGDRLYEPRSGRYLAPDPTPAFYERFDSFNRYAHGGNASGIFMEPRCNQTHKNYQESNFWRDFVGGLPQSTIEGFWATINFWKPGNLVAGFRSDWILGEPTPGTLASQARQYGGSFWEKTVQEIFIQALWIEGDLATGLFPKGILGPRGRLDVGRLGHLGIRERAAFGALHFGTPGGKDIKALLHFYPWRLYVGGKQGGVSIPYTLWGLAANLGRFYGTRMDRPYWWWSPMKWVSMEEYHRRIEEEGRQQAALAATEAERRKYRDDQKKPFKGPDWPDGGGGGGGGPGGFGGPLDGGFLDPFQSVETQLGGIELSAEAEFIGNLGSIAGAVYDPERQVVVLISEDEDKYLPTMSPEDLAVAFMLVYGTYPQDPQFTLDPADPRNPKGKWLRAVYTPEEVLVGTPFGQALFEADWLLKQYAFGVRIDREGNLSERTSSVAGLKSTADLTFEATDSSMEERWARFWIVVDDMDRDTLHNMTLKLANDGKSIYFNVAKMRVRARKQVIDPSSPTGLRDVDTDDPISTEFARLFTDLYDQVAQESPEFERVRQLAKAVALAKWMKREEIPVDLSWIDEYLQKGTQAVDSVTALSVRKQKQDQKTCFEGNVQTIETMTHEVHLFGGVDLTVKPRYDDDDDGKARSLRDAVQSKLETNGDQPVFVVNQGKEVFRAVVLPLTGKGKEMWERPSSIVVDNIEYRFNPQGNVIQSLDGNNTATYSYDVQGKLETVSMSLENGWRATGEKDESGGSSWSISNPRGTTFEQVYDGTGLLVETKADGNTFSTIDYDREGRRISCDYGDYVEKLSYDGKGNLVEYEVRGRRNQTDHIVEKATFSYNEDNDIEEISIPGSGRFDISYVGDEPRISKTTGPYGEVSYSYTPEGRIEEISPSSGRVIAYSYAGDEMSGIRVKNGDKEAEYLFDEEHLVQSRDLQGYEQAYSYTDDGSIASVVDAESRELRYLYDTRNRLREVHFPDGQWIEYRYQDISVKPAFSSTGLQSQSVSVILHSSSPALPQRSRQSEVEQLSRLDRIIRDRVRDDTKACNLHDDSVILDLYVDPDESAHLNVVSSAGGVSHVSGEIAGEFRRLVDITSKTKGKLGESLVQDWERFYEEHLKEQAAPRRWHTPDGEGVLIKPILILKSNEVNYKYSNIEKVPVLEENFIMFIASRVEGPRGISETTAEEMIRKINDIPQLTADNVLFTIKLPGMEEQMMSEWDAEIRSLKEIVGEENVVLNPTKQEFQRAIQNRSKDLIVIELTHTDEAIILRAGNMYKSNDILRGEDLSHIKYFVSGLGTCNLPLLEKGRIVNALKVKGVGMINSSYREVPADVALERLKKLNEILRRPEEYPFPFFHIIDIINQTLDFFGMGPTNIGLYELPISLQKDVG